MERAGGCSSSHCSQMMLIMFLFIEIELTKILVLSFPLTASKAFETVFFFPFEFLLFACFSNVKPVLETHLSSCFHWNYSISL